MFFLVHLWLHGKPKSKLRFHALSTEAEYRALASTVCEVQWLLFLLGDLHLKHDDPMAVLRDNKSAIHIAENLVFHERMKHKDIDYHVVREKLQTGVISLLPVCSLQ